MPFDTPQAIGFINAFDELADPELRLGRKVANYGLVTALLEHTPGDLELHFFLPFGAALEPFERVYAPWLERQGIKDRVKLFHAASLPAQLKRQSYLAIHAAELDRYFPELCHLRNRWAAEPFPITCTTHSLNYWSTQVRNVYKIFPGPREFDAVWCTSRAALGYVSGCLESQAEALAAMGMQDAGFKGRLDVMPLGVRAAEFGGITQAQARERLGISLDRLAFLCVGRLTQADKFDLTPLLGMLALINQKHDACLILAGAKEGGYAEQLVRTAATLGLGDRLHIFPDFEAGLKPHLYAASDVFVSPADNLQETFGLTILEAMAAGKPVVASDFSGYRDLVADGRTGYLIPTLGPASYEILDAVRPVLPDHIAALQTAQRTALDPAALLQRLEELAGSPGLRAQMGRAGRGRVDSRFDWAVVMERMVRSWRELKSEALRAGNQEKPPDVCGGGQARLFGHFVTRSICAEDRLEPGPLAQLFKAGVWADLQPVDLAGGLPRAGLERILGLIKAAGGGVALSRLQTGLDREMPPYLVEHLVLYGIKYGVLALAL